MRLPFVIASSLALAGCVSPTTPEGCPIYMTEALQAQTRACQQAYYEEKARATGGTVTRCFGEAGNMTCVSE
jgi:hypothetical protein